MDPELCLDPDPELGKFKAGSRSGINLSGSTTLLQTVCGSGQYNTSRDEREMIKKHLLEPPVGLAATCKIFVTRYPTIYISTQLSRINSGYELVPVPV